MKPGEEKEKQIRKYFNQLDRSLFIPDEVKESAHWDLPLPIGFGQTISQPSLVLEMTLLLDLQSHHRVLEIGTGSGYQTAFLAEFAESVYTIERFEALSLTAQDALTRLGYKNVSYRIGDGSQGWPDHGPYDRIMVTAAASRLPQALVDQLKPGGKMVIPIGPRAMQRVMVIERLADGSVKAEAMMGVQFVEFVGQYGWERESQGTTGV